MQNHQLTTQFSARVFEAFSDKSISWNAAKAIGEIAAVDPILTKRNHAVIKVSLFSIYGLIYHHCMIGFAFPEICNCCPS